jgi:hypothetical protein
LPVKTLGTDLILWIRSLTLNWSITIKDNIVEVVLNEPIDTPNTYVVRVKNGLCSLDVYENKKSEKVKK